MSTVATLPACPRRMLDGSLRETWKVTVDAVDVGTIEMDEKGDWLWQLRSMVSATPARFGLRCNAVDELVHAASLPNAWHHHDRGHRVTERLVIVPKGGEDE